MNLASDKLLSNVAFNCNLRHYNLVPTTAPDGHDKYPTDAVAGCCSLTPGSPQPDPRLTPG